MPNKSVKGTRRPLAVLEFGFYQGWAASFRFRWRRAPYRDVRSSRFSGYLRIGLSGTGCSLSNSASCCLVRRLGFLQGSV